LESLSDVDFSAIKIGLLPNKEILELTKNWLTALSVKSDTPIILDPVIVFKENADYSVNEMRDLFISQLFPFGDCNYPESQRSRNTDRAVSKK
jgi:Hydroxymethylpyrimidine/phosphomethylpyrimidine kinase